MSTSYHRKQNENLFSVEDRFFDICHFFHNGKKSPFPKNEDFLRLLTGITKNFFNNILILSSGHYRESDIESCGFSYINLLKLANLKQLQMKKQFVETSCFFRLLKLDSNQRPVGQKHCRLASLCSQHSVFFPIRLDCFFCRWQRNLANQLTARISCGCKSSGRFKKIKSSKSLTYCY